MVIFFFGVITLITASRLIVQALGWTAPVEAASGVPPLWAYPLLGSVSGLFSGLLGIGGGGYVVLGFSVFYNVPVQGTLPIALALNVTNAHSGVLAQRRKGQVRWREVTRLAPAALVGIGAGTALAVALPPDQMRILFGGFFLFMAGRLIRQAWKM